jgi:hypothetical protein
VKKTLPPLDMKQLTDFFDYAVKREAIRKAKESGETVDFSDPILTKYRFCNIFREDDAVTRWAATNIRPYYTGSDLIFAYYLFRMFNRPATVNLILAIDGIRFFSVERCWEAIKDEQPVVNAAYTVIGKHGYPKGLGILHTLNDIHRDRDAIYQDIMSVQTLECAVKRLGEYHLIGDFLAYEIATDLRHTSILGNAADIMTWANPGPGAARGLSRIIGANKHFFNRISKLDHGIMMEIMREILNYSTNPNFWPSHAQQWEMRDVEHTLCEFDKYKRAESGEGRPKQLYKGTMICT